MVSKRTKNHLVYGMEIAFMLVWYVVWLSSVQLDNVINHLTN